MKNGSSALRFDEFFEAESQHRTRGHSRKIVKQGNKTHLFARRSRSPRSFNLVWTEAAYETSY